ncbi:MAG: exonuclease [Thermoproteota archaeon]|nr:exonuclease [Thermoproteota archaeon]
MDYKVLVNHNNEILISNNKKKIYLDPKNVQDESLIFISHAHTDHLLNKKNLKKFNLKNRIISSTETSTIANSRGFLIRDFVEEFEDFKLIDNGHILGSKGLLINDDIFYTSDLSIRNRAFLKRPVIPRVSTLIIESTFGKPQYKFPPIEKIIHQVNSLIAEMYSRGIPVILMGYSLGKAQILTALFGSWKPLIVHDDIHKFNDIYRKFGVELENSIKLTDAVSKEILKNKPWVLIYPLTSGRQKFIKFLKEKYNAVTIGFSGWAINKNYSHIMNLDYTIPFSDHCDFNELIEVVRKSNPSKVFTFHGFQEEFADYLKKLGFDAEPVYNRNITKNRSLDNFL